MRHGCIYISDFVDLVYRNAYKPWDIRFLNHRIASRIDGNTTLVVGALEDGDARNIPCPDIPEHTIVIGDRIKHRGWRSLLRILMYDRTIRPSREIQKLLGDDEFHQGTKGLGCY